MIFFSVPGECCGQGTTNLGTQMATPVPNPFPVQGGLICDERYLTLPIVPRAKLIGVPKNANCQTFLGGPKSGIVQFDAVTGEAFIAGAANAPVEGEPPPVPGEGTLTIPLDVINPKQGGLYTTTGFDFTFLVGAGPGAGTTTDWFFAAAPGFGGTWLLAAVNGRWKMVEGGTIPGLNQVATAPIADKGLVLVMVQAGLQTDGSPAYALRMLSITHRRVIVGDNNAGVWGHMTLPEGEPLEHPLIRALADLSTLQYRQLTPTGNDIAGGIPVLITAGVGVISDAVPAMYSPGMKNFHRAPARTKIALDSDSEVETVDNNTWQSIPGHCLVIMRFDFPDFYISAMLRVQTRNNARNAIDGTYSHQFGLHVDGVLKFWWQIKGAKDNSLSRLVTGLSVGQNHTIEIKINRPNGGINDRLWVLNSNMDLFSVV